MSLVEFIRANYLEILALAREHLVLVLAASGMAVAIGVPLGVLLTRIRAMRMPVLGFANVMQTVPSLALFGLLIPVPFIGGIGARTAVIALSLYALLPVIRNTVTGILGVDARVRDAAVGMGMTDAQLLKRVEIPLALPVILTGIRVAVVVSVGVATVAAAIGAGGLGTYIFRGLRQNDNNLLVTGAVAAALLALLCDTAIGRFEAYYSSRRRRGSRSSWIAGIGISLVLAAIVLLPIFNFDRQTAADRTEAPVVVASKDFTESVILAEIFAQLLEAEGQQVERKLELGGNLPHDSLLAGAADVYPEYTGTAYTAILGRDPLTDPREVYSRVSSEYSERFGLSVSPPLGFANDFAILVRGEVARRLGLKTISDAVPYAKDWQAGFGQDFMSRKDGYEGFSKAYGFRFRKPPREMDLSLTYRALQAGEVDIIAGNSTDGLIAALDLVQLEDDRRYFPPYEAVFIVRSPVYGRFERSFRDLAGAISTDAMRRMNYEVDGSNRPPREVAADWIRSR